jgi:hypothetical protein
MKKSIKCGRLWQSCTRYNSDGIAGWELKKNK